MMQTFDYQGAGRLFLQTGEGLEELAAREVAAQGGTNVATTYRGLYFDGDHPTLARICYLSRLASRVLVPLRRFHCHSDKYLYRICREIPWESLLTPEQTLAVSANCHNSRIRHSQYAALRVKDAVVDRFTDLFGKRPSVDRHDADLRLHLHLDGNSAALYLDGGGGSLHRRGYRLQSREAPMQETLAAACIALTGWDGERPLADPMCGSGTLLIEALMSYCRIPAGYLRRRFGFFHLPEHDQRQWQALREEIDGQIRIPARELLRGYDIDPAAVDAARANAGTLPHGERILLRTIPFQKLDSLAGCTIVCNPPYGIRMGGERAHALIRELGDFLKRRCQGAEAYLFLGNRELIKSVGLKPAWKRPLNAGGLDARLVKYELY
ncbi:MAG: THUMP domain-containing protein [Thermodesulfobacteriota bacterium]